MKLWVNIMFLSILVIVALKTGSPIGNRAHQLSKSYWPTRLWFLCVSFLVLKLQVYTTHTSWMSDGKEFRLHFCSATTVLTESSRSVTVVSYIRWKLACTNDFNTFFVFYSARYFKFSFLVLTSDVKLLLLITL